MKKNTVKNSANIQFSMIAVLVSTMITACSGSDSPVEVPVVPPVLVSTPSPAPSPAPIPAPAPSPTPTPVAEATDKYVGTWVTACENDGVSSSIGSASFTKLSATVFAGTSTASTYSGTACAGAVVRVGGLRNMRMTIVGTKTASGLTVDKIMGTATEGVGKIIMYGDGAYIKTGSGGALDADGFPDNLVDVKFNKQ
jgi:hypothetical protein